ncbi:F-box domain containing protein [Metarhizium album ARSEF 1941]|uniref:F-box domain containing protein n=1 Tax=Metarhizium album (strain ARSEF 1941) TaxID=1081103 RepID=A0A0B2WQG3_METAS|nr:F-box domain containing protein [Metarhizium album ARSEF 1941]KHN98281.1 F-box domain containing protein [Metarhizium album ARSEF 1941]
MVSMAIMEDKVPSSFQEQAAGGSSSLRHSAFWYPRAPDPGLDLNDDCFTATESSNAKYQPLCWTVFGGRNGSYLRNLTGLSVTCSPLIRGIAFHYAVHTPEKTGTVGKFRARPNDSVTYFSIDGPGGEIVDTIEVFVQCSGGDAMRMVYNEDILVSTNRKRCFHVGKHESHLYGQISKRLIAVSPGSTITGLYWSQHLGRIIALGAISEIVGI